ncbi:adhesion G-protein coupled receptor G4 isoform X2 [Kryptolebias marmoratus]|uniref:adhesion G-protein coupled receptor G4 isoform X2 n=1 Tax=Kryptolebias marmoratus TaxID=37003 RepID=UPI0007F91B22|nr:adhesion G-protein coupled receptor G4 isoform X2 [Kryptolebias marmoratus]
MLCDLCLEGNWKWKLHFLQVICFFLAAVSPPTGLGYFLGDTKAVLNGCEDHWTLQSNIAMPWLSQMTVCVDIRVVVPGAWVAFSYGSAYAPNPVLGVEGDTQTIYVWLLQVQHRFPAQMSPMHWHRVCLRRDVQRNTFRLEVNGTIVAERTVIAQAILPSGSLWLGCRHKNQLPGVEMGKVELYLFRMWADLGVHEACEEGTVISWNAQYWSVTSSKAKETDPYLPCGLGPRKLLSPAVTTTLPSNTRPANQVSTSTSTHPITTLPVKQSPPGGLFTSGTPLWNCDISQLCSKQNAYFWMLLSVEGEKSNQTKQDVHNLVSKVFACNNDSNDAVHEVMSFNDFCQADGQLQVVEVSCRGNNGVNVSQTTCSVVLLLSHAVSACDLQRVGESALQQAAGSVRARIIANVERVGRNLCEDVSPSNGSFVRCTSTSSSDDICQSNRISEVTCSLFEPNSEPVPQPRTNVCHRPMPRFCDCTAFCDTASQFYTIRINITSKIDSLDYIKNLLLKPFLCLQQSECSDYWEISNHYKGAHLECHGTKERLYNCLVILEMSGPIDGCSLKTFVQQIIDKTNFITSDSPLNRMMVCGPPGLSVDSLLASNLTWVDSDRLPSDICQSDPVLFECEANETFAVLLADSCSPKPQTSRPTQATTETNRVTAAPKSTLPSATYTTEDSHPNVPFTHSASTQSETEHPVLHTSSHHLAGTLLNKTKETLSENTSTSSPNYNSTLHSSTTATNNLNIQNNATGFNNSKTTLSPNSIQHTTAFSMTTAEATITIPNHTIVNNVTKPSVFTTYETSKYNVTTVKLSPNHTVYNVTAVATNDTTSTNSYKTVYDVTTENSATMITNSAVTSKTRSNSPTVAPNYIYTQNVTSQNINHTKVYHVTTDKSDHMTSSPATDSNFTSLYTSLALSKNNNTTTLGHKYTTLYRTTTPSNGYTSEYNSTTPNDNNTTVYEKKISSNNVTTANNSTTSSNTYTAMYTVTPPSNTLTSTYNATTPNSNYRTTHKATTLSTIYTRANNATTSKNHTTLYNATTPSSIPTATSNAITPSNIHLNTYNVTTPSNFYSNTYNSSTPSNFHATTYNATTPSDMHTAIFNATKPGNIHSNTYNATTTSSNYRTTYNAALTSNNHTTVHNATTPSNIHMTTPNATIQSNSHSNIYIATAPNSNYRTTYNATPTSNIHTAVFNTTTPMNIYTTTYNATTPSKNYRTMYNGTTPSDIHTTTSNTTTLNNIYSALFNATTDSKNDTAAYNATTSSNIFQSMNSATTLNEKQVTYNASTIRSIYTTIYPTTMPTINYSAKNPRRNQTAAYNSSSHSNIYTNSYNTTTTSNFYRAMFNVTATTNSYTAGYNLSKPSNNYTTVDNATTPMNSYSATYSATTPTANYRTTDNATTSNNIYTLSNNTTTPSSIHTAMFNATTPSKNGRSLFNATTHMTNYTALYNATAPSNIHTTLYNATAPSNIHTTAHTTTKPTSSYTTVNDTLTQSSNVTAMNKVTTSSNTYTKVNNATTLSNIYTTVYNVTTSSNNYTAVYNETTPRKNYISGFNATTHSSNYTKVHNATAVVSNYTTLHNATTPATFITNRATTYTSATPSNNYTAMYNGLDNFTTVYSTSTPSNNYTTPMTTSPTTISQNQTTAFKTTTLPIREPQQNTTSVSTNTTLFFPATNATETTNMEDSTVETTTSLGDTTTKPTEASLSNHTANYTTVSVTGMTTDSKNSLAASSIQTTKAQSNLTITANASVAFTTIATTANTTHIPAEKKSTTADISLTSPKSTFQTTILTTTTTTISSTETTLVATGETTTNKKDEEEQANELLNQTQNTSQLNSTQVSNLVDNLEKLLDGEFVSQSVGQKIINVISNLMNGDSSTLYRLANRLIRLVDILGLKLEVTGDRVILSSASLVLAVRPVDGTNFPTTSVDILNTNNVQLRALSKSRLKRSGSTMGSVYLPSSLTAGLLPEEQKWASRVQFTFYTKNSLFMDAALDNQTVVSPVLGSSVANLSINNLKENIKFMIKNTHPVQASNISCVFWDFTLNMGRGGWRSDGCFVVNATPEYTSCSCNHLTSFAILLDLSRQGITDHKQARILTFITYIGCGISCVFLAFTLLTYLLFEKLLRDIPAKILVQLCLSILLLNLVFLLNGWLSTYSAEGLCISTAFFLHYFLLTTFTWAGLEALHMYLSIVRVFTPYLSRYMLKFSLMGWGIPLFVVIIVIAVDKNNYGLVTYGKYTDGTTDDFCWLRNDIAFYVGVVAYFLLIFSLCLVVFIVVMVQLNRIKKQNPHNQSPKRGLITDMRSIIGLVVLLGLTWGFALFAWGDLYLPFVYLFSIFNSLHGFFVFIFHCAVKENVRRQWRTYLCCGKLRLAENSDWSRMATQNKTSSAATVTTSDPHFIFHNAAVVSAPPNSNSAVFWDNGISDHSNSDVILNEIHRQNVSWQGET